MTPESNPHDHGPKPLPYRESWSDFFSKNGISRDALDRFKAIIFHYYLAHHREFSWREDITPYRVVISEMMLQQTQVSRVAQKFDHFVGIFTSFHELTKAPFAEVLKAWKGLGYNRRARYLHEIAQLVVDEHDGLLPNDPDILVGYPGIGPATAASICAFAFNEPVAFIETNIRTVYIHFFFADREQVHDREIMALVEKTIDRKRPREWYYALMDYGTMLKKTVGNLGRRSSHYRRQSRFEGSDRQLRGRILQILLDRQTVVERDLSILLGESPERVERVLAALCAEDLIVRRSGQLSIG